MLPCLMTWLFLDWNAAPTYKFFGTTKPVVVAIKSLRQDGDVIRRSARMLCPTRLILPRRRRDWIIVSVTSMSSLLRGQLKFSDE